MIVGIQVDRPSYHDLPHIEVPRTAVTEMSDTVLPASCVQPAVQKSARCTRVDCLWVLAEREDLSKVGPEDYDVDLAPTKGKENLIAMGVLMFIGPTSESGSSLLSCRTFLRQRTPLVQHLWADFCAISLPTEEQL